MITTEGPACEMMMTEGRCPQVGVCPGWRRMATAGRCSLLGVPTVESNNDGRLEVQDDDGRPLPSVWSMSRMQDDDDGKPLFSAWSVYPQ